MRELSIDIETFSSVDIGKAGLYKYVQSEDFEILLFAYSFDNGQVKIIDLAQGEQLPQEVVAALSDKNVIKTAYNAAFEWYCLNKFWPTPIEQWSCTMVKGLYSRISSRSKSNRECNRARRRQEKISNRYSIN